MQFSYKQDTSALHKGDYLKQSLAIASREFTSCGDYWTSFFPANFLIWYFKEHEELISNLKPEVYTAV